MPKKIELFERNFRSAARKPKQSDLKKPKESKMFLNFILLLAEILSTANENDSKTTINVKQNRA